MNGLAVLMLAAAVFFVVVYLGPVMCTLSAQNKAVFRIAGFVLVGWTIVCLLTGTARFRSRRVVRAEDPFSYWFYILGILLLAGFALYPVHWC